MLKKVGNYVLDLESELGEGQFGKVYKGWLQGSPDTFYAIKVQKRKLVESSQMRSRLFENERHLLGDLDHPNIIKMVACLTTAENYYMVLPFCNQGDMGRYMKKLGVSRFSEEQAVDYLRQLMNGFQELRRKKIMHRDIKVENLLVDLPGPRLVIGDLGFAKAYKSEEEAHTSFLGTPATMAPEVKFGNSYDSKADLYSIGTVFHFFLTGRYPQSKDPLLLVRDLECSDKPNRKSFNISFILFSSNKIKI
jgi:serine/threonine protein kinase